MTYDKAEFARDLKATTGQTGLEEIYVPGSVLFNFSASTAIDWRHPFIVDEKADYEKKLQTALSFGDSDLAESEGGVVVVRGAAGSGKTTTLRHCVEKLRSNLRRRKSRQIILHVIWLDLDPNQGTFISDDNAEQEISQLLFNNLRRNIDKIFPKQMAVEEEFGQFFPWLLENSRILDSTPMLSRFVNGNQQKITAYQTETNYPGFNDSKEILASLTAERDELTRQVTDQELFLLQVAKFKYELSKKGSEKIRVIAVLDNIDQLSPKAQRLLVSGGVEISNYLECKVVFPLRPLTWRDTQGTARVSLNAHYSPDIEKVLRARTTYIAKKNNMDDAEKKAFVSNVVAAVFGDRLIRRFVRGVTGVNVRRYLESVVDYLSSPVFEGKSLAEINLQNFQHSQLCKAYTFGNGHSLRTSRFENLYAVGQDLNPSVSLLKPRILDYLLRINAGAAPAAKLLAFLRAFAYKDEDIETALNDLLDRRRALIWCEHAFSITLNDLPGNKKISIAPMGASYYQFLFGELLYAEVCLAKNRDDHVIAERALDFSDNLKIVDKIEVQRFITNSDAAEYERYYGFDVVGISYMYWEAFEKGISNRRLPGFDPKWRDAARYEMQSVTGRPYLRAG